MRMGLLFCLALCLARGAGAAEVVPAARVTDAAARALFGGGAPQGWRPTFRITDVPVPSAGWRLRAEARTTGERTRMALVMVEVDGRVVRRIPVVFSAAAVHRGDADVAGVRRRDASVAVVHRGDPAGVRRGDADVAVVHRGDAVKIVARRGTVACERAGEALRDGRRGERIQVRCGTHTMACVVAGPGEVEVERR